MLLSAELTITFISAIQAVPAAQWNALCGDDYPFTRHEFLLALEQSQSLGAPTGWQPQHLLVKKQQQLIAAVPLYLKSHSYGEYVFDWAWADAYQRYGVEYYPKLVTAIPFTPCAGARILCADAQLLIDLVPLIVEAIKAQAKVLSASGWHCLFPPPALSATLADGGITQRMGSQFHWYNRGYHTWDDFVLQMVSRKRKNINKERSQVRARGIQFVRKEGEQIEAADWALFYRLYCNTYLKRSGHKGYLTQSFFQIIGEVFAKNTLLIMAQMAEQPIAAALFFKSSTTLYGRYWGCLEEYDFLHFETCYYQGIDYAIQQGLQHFDGGAQGEHKIQRGFEPIATFSNHWLAHPDFQQAIDNFLQAEAKSVADYIDDAKRYLPFKEPDIPC